MFNFPSLRTSAVAQCLGTCAAILGLTVAPSFTNGETIMGDHLWNLRENAQDFFHDNVPYVRPWRFNQDDGWGMFVDGPMFLWGTDSTAGNPADGSLSIARGVDHQFDAWTYLFVPTPTTVSLTGDGDCVPRWFLNYQFDSPHEFPLGAPATINLAAGWNRLDITGYNQNRGFLFESGALAGQVTIMDSAGVPEPSTVSMLACFVITGGFVFALWQRSARRYYAVEAAGTDFRHRGRPQREEHGS